MALAVVVVVGFALGLAIGRWWTLIAAIAAWMWIWSSTGVDEVPHWFLGLLYGGATAIGIAAGVALTSRTRRGSNTSNQHCSKTRGTSKSAKPPTS
jgi:hypothetical protein